jgi:hypothetical protein
MKPHLLTIRIWAYDPVTTKLLVAVIAYQREKPVAQIEMNLN